MLVRRALLRALTLTAVGLTTLAAVPAQADTQPTLSTPDVSTPGHVAGTTTSDADYVQIRLSTGATTVETTYVSTVGGAEGAFDLETWGLTVGTITATACTAPDTAACTGGSTSATFTPSDVAPEVTWPADDRVGPGETYTISVSDPRGGGTLRALWWGGEPTSLAREGQTQLSLVDGEHEISIVRCGPVSCADTGLRRNITVNREVQAYLYTYARTLVAPGGGQPDQVLFVHVDSSEPADPVYELAWDVRDAAGQPVPGVSGVATDLGPGLSLQVPLDLSGLSSGRYSVGGTLSYLDVDGTRVSGPVPHRLLFRVDAVAPTASASANFDTIYPDRHDGYRNAVTVRVKDRSERLRKLRATVTGPDGALVNTLGRRLVWKGDDVGGRMVPEGKYNVHVTVTDNAGNRTTLKALPVKVSHERLVSRVHKVTVSATGSLVDEWAGRCSQVSKPAPGRGPGSVMLATNTRCGATTWRASGAVVVNAVRVPRAFAYRTLQVNTVGGASSSTPGSRASMEYWNTVAGTWGSARLLDSSFGRHLGDLADARNRVSSNRWVVWRTATAYGASYDVKAYIVRLRYQVLV